MENVREFRMRINENMMILNSDEKNLKKKFSIKYNCSNHLNIFLNFVLFIQRRVSFVIDHDVIVLQIV